MPKYTTCPKCRWPVERCSCRLPKVMSAGAIIESGATPLVGTGSWLGRDNCGLFATPDAVALALNPATGEAKLIITKPESAAVIICDDGNTARPNTTMSRTAQEKGQPQ